MHCEEVLHCIGIPKYRDFDIQAKRNQNIIRRLPERFRVRKHSNPLAKLWFGRDRERFGCNFNLSKRGESAIYLSTANIFAYYLFFCILLLWLCLNN